MMFTFVINCYYMLILTLCYSLAKKKKINAVMYSV